MYGRWAVCVVKQWRGREEQSVKYTITNEASQRHPFIIEMRRSVGRGQTVYWSKIRTIWWERLATMVEWPSRPGNTALNISIKLSIMGRLRRQSVNHCSTPLLIGLVALQIGYRYYHSININNVLSFFFYIIIPKSNILLVLMSYSSLIASLN